MFENRFRDVCVVVALAGVAVGVSAGADVDSAQRRVEEAQRAVELALAELRAAEAELADAQGGTGRRSVAQPESGDQASAAIEDEPGFFGGWDYSLSAGITGSSGNSENFSGRVRLDGERLTEAMETRIHAQYLYETSDGQQSASRGEAGIKNDWLLDGPWRVFANGLYEYDEFQAWQHRLSAAGGVGYEFVKNEKTTLVGRVGAGGSFETGANADEEFVPEGYAGLSLSHKLSEATSFEASTEYFPSFDDAGEFRMTNSVGLEVILDAETGMTFGAGAEHRHDSDPGMGIKPNDLDYYMTIGWKF